MKIAATALRRRIRDLEIAAENVVEAYVSRFENRPGSLFGPIDEHIEALRATLQKPLPKGTTP